jgi:hypothetical protein
MQILYSFLDTVAVEKFVTEGQAKKTDLKFSPTPAMILGLISNYIICIQGQQHMDSTIAPATKSG